MTEDQYNLLCNCCDSFLLDQDSDVDSLAIPWLHIMNEHPVNQVKYNSVFADNTSNNLIAIKSLLRTVFDFFKTVKSIDGWHLSRDISESVDVLFVSHLLNSKQIGAKEDFYYGSLPEKCLEKGISSAVLLHDHTGCNINSILGKWPSSNAPRIILDRTLPWRDELSLRTRLTRQSQRLLRLAKKNSSSLQQRIFRQASKQAMNSNSIYTLRFFMQLGKLIDRIKPKVIVVTYEGHAWERLAFAAARKIEPTIACIGYQHAILFPRQHAAMRSLGPAYNPDLIFTTGLVTETVFREEKKVGSASVATIGTHRFKLPNCDVSEKFQAHAHLSCLVIPDGTISECLIIFKFALKAAELMPSIKFIFRMHPVLKIESLFGALPQLTTLPQNIEVSIKEIEDDLSRARWALYRGSSAAIHAVISGVRPFYINQIGELSMDPMYQLSVWRIIVNSPIDFVAQVQIDLESQSEILETEWSSAKNFCISYFQPLNCAEFFSQIKEHVA